MFVVRLACSTASCSRFCCSQRLDPNALAIAIAESQKEELEKQLKTVAAERAALSAAQAKLKEEAKERKAAELEVCSR